MLILHWKSGRGGHLTCFWKDDRSAIAHSAILPQAIVTRFPRRKRHSAINSGCLRWAQYASHAVAT